MIKALLMIANCVKFFLLPDFGAEGGYKAYLNWREYD
tara:strand:- start:756 stop:866 length:111 start_codon:yes stop_codon:yes gene_type:complete